MIKEEVQYQKMIKTPVKKLVIMLGLPTTISMLVTAIYNIADTYFVSQLGKSASGAVGVVFSLMAVIQAIGFTLGMGGSSIISSLLGQKKNEEAQKVGSTSFYTAILLGFLITIFGLLFINPLMRLLGSTETALPYAIDYATYIIYGAPIMTGSFVMNNILRAEGKAKLAMIGLTTGGILNIILDPLFINNLQLGISGAAIATLISQLVSFILLLIMFLFKKSIIRLSIFKISRDIKVYFEIIKVGLPSLCRQGLASLATILLNNQAGYYGADAALSAMSIVSKVIMVIFSVSLGIGQGYQPVCGYNYFAKRYNRVKEAMIFTFVVSTTLLTTFSLILIIFSKQIIGIFIDDEEVIKIGMVALRFQCIALPFLSLNTICNMTFQSIRKKVRATLLSCCRQGIFFIPLIFILPSLFGLVGVEITQAIADILTCAFSVFFFIDFTKHISKKIEKMKQEEKLSIAN